jgi:hypothetical protein
MGAEVPESAALWAHLRRETFKSMGRYLERSPVHDKVDTRLAVAALASMVEQSANLWFIEFASTGSDAPTLDEAADTLSFLWYRAVYE